MKNPYRRFLNQLELKPDGKGFRVVQPEILFIGYPIPRLVVARPFTPEETHLWVAKYGGLTRPSFNEESQTTKLDNSETSHIVKIGRYGLE